MATRCECSAYSIVCVRRLTGRKHINAASGGSDIQLCDAHRKHPHPHCYHKVHRIKAYMLRK